MSERTQIIAEVCQNHNGDRKILAELIAAAAKSGADYVKGQVIFSEDVTHRPRFDEGMTEQNGIVKAIKRPFVAEVERLSKLDLTPDDYRFFVEECVRQGVKPLITVFTRKRIPFVASLPWSERTIKVASPDCISYPFLRELAASFDHIIISTGGATDEEIAKAAETVKAAGKKVTLLHCVSIYPNPLNLCNLSRMEYLRAYTPFVGWSDHTLVERDGIKAAKVASMLGASHIERHFTVLKADQSKDGPVSITPDLLRGLADFVRLSKEEQQKVIEKEIPNWRTLLGVPTRELSQREALNMDYFRGRFASRVGERWVYNWEERPLTED